MVKIIPAILARSFTEFKDKISFLDSKYKLVQLDVMDGKFVRNKTFFDFKKIIKIKRPVEYELHLMVKEPLKFLKKHPSAKLRVTSIIIHIEALKQADLGEFLALRKKVRIGLAINPATPVGKLKKYCGLIDQVLIMGVVPGKSGQKFIKSTLNKIKMARKICPQIEIEVDGGVNTKNIQAIFKAGADKVASASMIFNTLKS